MMGGWGYERGETTHGKYRATCIIAMAPWGVLLSGCMTSIAIGPFFNPPLCLPVDSGCAERLKRVENAWMLHGRST